MAIINGTNKNDTLNGTAGADFIYGFAGNDVLFGSNGKDTLYGDLGNDTLDGGNGNDVLYGDTGNDQLLSSSGNDTLDGGAGKDQFILRGSGTVHADGGRGDDSFDLTTFSGTSYLNGGDGKESFTAGQLFGSIVNISGGNGDDAFNLTGGHAKNALFDGGKGNDSIFYAASLGNVTLIGGVGNDRLIYAGDKQPELNPDKVILDGGDGNDELHESTAAHFELNGGNGNDTLGVGSNFVTNTGSITGGAGFDTFDLELGRGGFLNALPTITDFKIGQDHFSVDADNFGGGLVAGMLNALQFGIGTVATTAEERFIYDNTAGTLYFDQDGNGAGSAQVQLAIIGNLVALSATDFMVV